jgi:hypothetical protein
MVMITNVLSVIPKDTAGISSKPQYLYHFNTVLYSTLHGRWNRDESEIQQQPRCCSHSPGLLDPVSARAPVSSLMPLNTC